MLRPDGTKPGQESMPSTPTHRKREDTKGVQRNESEAHRHSKAKLGTQRAERANQMREESNIAAQDAKQVSITRHNSARLSSCCWAGGDPHGENTSPNVETERQALGT